MKSKLVMEQLQPLQHVTKMISRSTKFSYTPMKSWQSNHNKVSYPTQDNMHEHTFLQMNSLHTHTRTHTHTHMYMHATHFVRTQTHYTYTCYINHCIVCGPMLIYKSLLWTKTNLFYLLVSIVRWYNFSPRTGLNDRYSIREIDCSIHYDSYTMGDPVAKAAEDF